MVPSSDPLPLYNSHIYLTTTYPPTSPPLPHQHLLIAVLSLIPHPSLPPPLTTTLTMLIILILVPLQAHTIAEIPPISSQN